MPWPRGASGSPTTTSCAVSTSVPRPSTDSAREDAAVLAAVERFRQGRPIPPLAERDVVLVDDGLATGMTALAALRAVRTLAPARLVLAEPVCAAAAVQQLSSEADDIVRAHVPQQFHAVGAWYVDFSPTSDDEVLRHLQATLPR